MFVKENGFDGGVGDVGGLLDEFRFSTIISLQLLKSPVNVSQLFRPWSISSIWYIWSLYFTTHFSLGHASSSHPLDGGV